MFCIRLFGTEVELKPFGWESVFKRKSAFLNQKQPRYICAAWLKVCLFVHIFLARSGISLMRNCGSQGKEERKRLQPIIHLGVTKISLMCQVVQCRWYNLTLTCIATHHHTFLNYLCHWHSVYTQSHCTFSPCYKKTPLISKYQKQLRIGLPPWKFTYLYINIHMKYDFKVFIL